MFSRILERISNGTDQADGPEVTQDTKKVALVGSPNVGKSVLFGNLTRTYVTVSNYPGTTVEVARGSARIDDEKWEVIDTPGMYSIRPLSEEERVARRILLNEKPDVVLHVVDASNLQRMLQLTLQLVNAGLPVVLVLNMLDEAESAGLEIDASILEQELGIPVVGTVGTSGRGMAEVRRAMARAASGSDALVDNESSRENAILDAADQIAARLQGDYPVSRRSIGLLLLQDDQEIREMLERNEPGGFDDVADVVRETRQAFNNPLEYTITLRRQSRVNELCQRALSRVKEDKEGLADRLSGLMTHPIAGIPFLLLVLYFGLYQLVGVFGAGTAVDYLEATVFGEYVNPAVQSAVDATVPTQALRDLVAGEYGVITLGVRYAVAIVLPIVTLFFLVFSFLEDVGYLPRLALLLDRLFKKIGLSGRAVIPMVLGFGCDTMATMVTRTLSTKRERLIAILLLSVAVPCSAQLGVIMGILSSVPGALAIWAGVLVFVYLATGFLASLLVPGRPAPFYVEVPPLRWPKLSNIASKTFARVKWYFKEVLPLFVLASVLIWFSRLTGLFSAVVRALSYPVRWIGLPAESARVFLFGFFRRDYGAAGLYDMADQGVLSGTEMVVAAVALTLFMPCIAHFLMTIRERGWKQSAAIAACTLVIAFVTAVALSFSLTFLGVTL